MWRRRKTSMRVHQKRTTRRTRKRKGKRLRQRRARSAGAPRRTAPRPAPQGANAVLAAAMPMTANPHPHPQLLPESATRAASRQLRQTRQLAKRRQGKAAQAPCRQRQWKRVAPYWRLYRSCALGRTERRPRRQCMRFPSCCCSRSRSPSSRSSQEAVVAAAAARAGSTGRACCGRSRSGWRRRWCRAARLRRARQQRLRPWVAWARWNRHCLQVRRVGWSGAF